VRADEPEAPAAVRAPGSETGAGLIGPAAPRGHRRDMCIWLGTLASWRGGLIKRLVGLHGSVDGILTQPPLSLAKVAGRSAVERSGGSPRRAPGSTPAGVNETSQDEARFLAALERGPDGLGDAPAPRGGLVVAWCDELYPKPLRHLPDPPLCLFVRAACGHDELERRLLAAGAATAVAVVGTRGPSAYGEEMARLLGRDLAQRGVLVVSGMAMGVDAAAHRGALGAGGEAKVATVAVLGCGADVPYPRVNRLLYDEVLERGLVLSEFAWGVPARAWRFPARNRVMAGLSRAVVIVEGAERSGARLTVDYALELGREVLAVPGEAGRRLTAAPHAFLRDGAALCESAQDVLAALGIPDHGATTRLPEASSGDDGAGGGLGIDYAGAVPLLHALVDGALSADQAAARCGLPVHEAAGWLSRLEVDGLVALEAGGSYRLRRQ
jgi:DNA processing protein